MAHNNSSINQDGEPGEFLISQISKKCYHCNIQDCSPILISEVSKKRECIAHTHTHTHVSAHTNTHTYMVVSRASSSFFLPPNSLFIKRKLCRTPRRFSLYLMISVTLIAAIVVTFLVFQRKSPKAALKSGMCT